MTKLYGRRSNFQTTAPLGIECKLFFSILRVNKKESCAYLCRNHLLLVIICWAAVRIQPEAIDACELLSAFQHVFYAPFPSAVVDWVGYYNIMEVWNLLTEIIWTYAIFGAAQPAVTLLKIRPAVSSDDTMITTNLWTGGHHQAFKVWWGRRLPLIITGPVGSP